MLSQYKTVYCGGEAEIIEKKSRFIATIRKCESEEEAVAFIEEMEENTKIHMTEVCEKYMKEKKCGTYIIKEDEWNDMGELDKLNKMMEK